MNAQKFSHSVGQLFKKIDRTLSFLPEKPRKAVIATTALAISPILAGVIISQAKNKNASYNTEEISKERNQDSLVLNDQEGTLLDEVDFHASLGDSNYNGWRFGKDGYGLYAEGRKIL